MVKSLAVFDIDGTIREIVDPWMMLHNYYNTQEAGGIIYNDWVNGKITYHEMCEKDAFLWKDKSKNDMLVPLASNNIREGVSEMIQYLKKQKFLCIGISTGLSFYNEVTVNEVGLDYVISNDIIFEDQKCTGEVIVNVEEYKKDIILNNVLQKERINGRIISFGDGKSDIDLFKNSHLSFAVHSKYDEVKKAATHIFNGKSFIDLIQHL